jgi:hypothetical protein
MDRGTNVASVHGAMRIADLPMVQKAQRRLGRHGAAAFVHFFLLKLINLVLPFRILRGVHVAHAAPEFLSHPPAYTPSFLAPGELKAFAADPRTEMSRAFVEDALRNGDECYAICDGPRLAAYGWYSTRPTPIDLSGLTLRFADDHVYMYKGFTDRDYRGQRLHAIGMTRALQHYLDGGCRGIVSYVESTNFDSLKSCFRMGYEVFGSIYAVELFGRWFAFSSPGCGRFAFRLVSTPRPEPLSATALQPVPVERRHTSRTG